MASRSVVYRSRIDLRDTDKFRHFAITEINNCFIIRSLSLIFKQYLREAKRSGNFHARAIARKRKAWFHLCMSRIYIIIRCKCFFLFIGGEPTTRPANNCLQIMVCSCAMYFNCFWLQILFCLCVNETTLAPSCDHGRSLRRLGRERFGMFTRS